MGTPGCARSANQSRARPCPAFNLAEVFNMKRVAGWWVAAVLASSAGFAADAQSAHEIVLRAQTLIDAASAAPRHRVDIVVRGNRIVEVAATGSRPVPEGAEVLDLGPLTVLP